VTQQVLWDELFRSVLTKFPLKGNLPVYTKCESNVQGEAVTADQNIFDV